jgi:hypothetical protein
MFACIESLPLILHKPIADSGIIPSFFAFFAAFCSDIFHFEQQDRKGRQEESKRTTSFLFLAFCGRMLLNQRTQNT